MEEGQKEIEFDKTTKYKELKEIEYINFQKNYLPFFLRSKFHEKYLNDIMPLIIGQEVFEDACIKTKMGNQGCNKRGNFITNNKTFELSYSQIFFMMAELIKSHNRDYYDKSSDTGIFIDIAASKEQTSLASFSGKNRNVSLIPRFRGLSKKALKNFIKEVIGYRNFFPFFTPDPNNPRYKDSTHPEYFSMDPRGFFSTFSNRNKDYFYIDNIRNAVVLPSLDSAIFTKHRSNWDEIKNSPEIILMSSLAWALKQEVKGTNIIDTNIKLKKIDGIHSNIYEGLEKLTNLDVEDYYCLLRIDLNEKENQSEYAVCSAIIKIMRDSAVEMPKPFGEKEVCYTTSIQNIVKKREYLLKNLKRTSRFSCPEYFFD